MDPLSLALTILGLVLAVIALPGSWTWLSKRVATFRAQRSRTFFTSEMLSRMSPAEVRAKDRLYYFPGGWIRAVRLWGAQGQNARIEEVDATYTHTKLVPPPEFEPGLAEIVARLRTEATAAGRRFFNGPNTRLIDWRASPADGPAVARERDHVHLTLGPVGWEEYSGLNDAFSAERTRSGILAVYEHYIGLSDLIRDLSVRSSKLSNILDTATTIITKDGFAGYQIRSGRVSTAVGRLTSAIAENINRWLDEVDPLDPSRPLNADRVAAKQTKPDNTYVPRGIPHPFAAVRRGLTSELSPRLEEVVQMHHIRLTGLSFDLEALHPDALFVAFVNATRPEVEQMRAASPGDEHDEGELHFTPASLDSNETLALLKNPGWTPAGQASLFRALEFLDSVKRDNHLSFAGAFELFIRGHQLDATSSQRGEGSRGA